MASVRTLLVALSVCAVAAFVFGSAPRAREAAEVVKLSADSNVSIATPAFISVGKRYAFTWAGGGPAQTYTVKSLRSDGWVLVEVAEENTNPALLIPGEHPVRWLNAGIAISIQEMRPHQF